MEPRFFGNSEKPLFGVHYAAQSGQRPNGVLICNPFGVEAIVADRALRQLAVILSRRGHDVFRFDFHGSGDSSGESESGSLTQWQDDLMIAIDELKDCTGLSTVALVGLRLGASIALEAATTRSDVRSVVAWEPVVAGHDYLLELVETQKDWLKQFSGQSRSESGNEVLGFPITDAIMGGLEAFDFLQCDSLAIREMLVVQNTDSPGLNSFCDHARRLGADVELLKIEAPPVWKKRGVNKALVPVDVLQSIALWLERTGP